MKFCWSRSFVSRFLFGIPLLLASSSIAFAQLNIIHQEGFNDDGVAAGRYTMRGRGALVGADGPGAWEHSFLVDEIGLPSQAPARRAAILWTDNATEDDFTEESLLIWNNLLDYMLDGKENAAVGFLPGLDTNSADFLAFLLEEGGHDPFDIPADVPGPGDVDLIIHIGAGNPPSPSDLNGVAVPVITYNAGNHDDTAVSTIGTPTTGGPTTVSIVAENSDHPVLAGITGPTIPWVDEFIAEEPLQGIGISTPAGSQTLATYIDPATGLELPALLLIEEGSDLLGAFNPVPEGEGFIIGGDLNLDFGNGDGAGSETDPVLLTLDPIDLSGQSGVKLSVDLAATSVDFEDNDFLRVAYSDSENAAPEDFVILGEFRGLDDSSSPNHKALVDPNLGALNPNEFTTFTFELPDDLDQVVVQFQGFSTWPNEVLGIDNVVVFTGEAGNPLDCSGDGALTGDDVACADAATIGDILSGLNVLSGDLDLNGNVEFADFLILSGNFGDDSKGGVYANGDLDLNGKIEFADFLTFSANFGKEPAAAAAAVPEPTAGLLLFSASLLLGGLRKRR